MNGATRYLLQVAEHTTCEFWIIKNFQKINIQFYFIFSTTKTEYPKPHKNLF